MRDRIDISVEHKKALQKEFNTSETSVRYSLNYVFNSSQAKAIRQRAKEMLQEEVEKIEQNEQASKSEESSAA